MPMPRRLGRRRMQGSIHALLSPEKSPRGNFRAWRLTNSEARHDRARGAYPAAGKVHRISSRATRTTGHAVSKKENLTRPPSLPVAYIAKRPAMYGRTDPLISASRGTLAGDLLWFGTIGFILAIITGVIS